MYDHVEKFKTIQERHGNQNCFECGIAGNQWASVNNGIFLCLTCSGKHRGFGVNISFVRSVLMDNW
jgi:ADP-ribosylation factor GTPase-activating protein 1